MIDSPFLIAGGGVAGLAAALGLARIGQGSRVFERAPEFSEVGAGVQLGPNAAAALQWLGAWETVAPHTFAPKEIQVRDGITGKLLQRIRLGPFEDMFGMPYRVVLRSHLLKGLLDHARSSSFVSLEAGKATAPSTLHEGLILVDGATVSGQGLIAADGVHSTFRTALQGIENKYRQSHTLYRKLLPREHWPNSLDPDLVVLWLCPGGHVVHYAVDGGRSLNMVASVEESESGNGPSLAGLCHALASLLSTMGEWLIWPGFALAPDRRWVTGKTALAGDAAHAMLPYLAQGAAMALEDACVLAMQLAKSPDVAAAFNTYAECRYTRVTQVQASANAQGRIYHASGLSRLARNTALRLMPEGLFLRRLSWIYAWRP